MQLFELFNGQICQYAYLNITGQGIDDLSLQIVDVGMVSNLLNT